MNITDVYNVLNSTFYVVIYSDHEIHLNFSLYQMINFVLRFVLMLIYIVQTQRPIYCDIFNNCNVITCINMITETNKCMWLDN